MDEMGTRERGREGVCGLWLRCGEVSVSRVCVCGLVSGPGFFFPA